MLFKDPGLSQKMNDNGQWEILINKCTRALDKLLEMAPTRRRNYILDQVCNFFFLCKKLLTMSFRRAREISGLCVF